jgi:hypothetical protein
VEPIDQPVAQINCCGLVVFEQSEPGAEHFAGILVTPRLNEPLQQLGLSIRQDHIARDQE